MYFFELVLKMDLKRELKVQGSRRLSNDRLLFSIPLVPQRGRTRNKQTDNIYVKATI